MLLTTWHDSTSPNRGPVRVCDTTLRDGEQAPGVAFSVAEKTAIASALDNIGVHAIEAGVPAMGSVEAESLRRIASAGLTAEVVAWCRATRSDLRAALACGVRSVHLAVPVSDLHLSNKLGRDRAWATRQIVECVQHATDLGMRVSVGFEDASRANDDFVIELAGALVRLGVTRLRWADTVGILDPFAAVDRLTRLVQAVGAPWEIHAHDDYGLATANTLAAVQAGFTWVSTTVAGLGERAGNAALEEVVMALRHLVRIDPGLRTTGFKHLARMVAHASRRPVPKGKAVVGTSVFAHESGIHVDGVLKATATYEPYDPAEVGARRRLLVGKHSGRAALRHALARHGVEAAADDLQLLLDQVRSRACELKRGLRVHEVRELFDVRQQPAPHDHERTPMTEASRNQNRRPR